MSGNVQLLFVQFYPTTPPLPQMQRVKRIAISVANVQTNEFHSLVSLAENLCSQDLFCYIHRLEPAPFRSYSFVRRIFHSGSFFSRNATLWNFIDASPKYYHLNLFKSSINLHRLSMLSILFSSDFCLLLSYHELHLVNSYIKWVLDHVLSEL